MKFPQNVLASIAKCFRSLQYTNLLFIYNIGKGRGGKNSVPGRKPYLNRKPEASRLILVFMSREVGVAEDEAGCDGPGFRLPISMVNSGQQMKQARAKEVR